LAPINSINGPYNFKHLPALAKIIADGKVEEFATEQLRLSRQFNVPLLKFLSQYSDIELIALSIASIEELLTYLANNDAANQIDHSLQKWISNQMEIVNKYDIVAEDVTLLNHVRGRVLKKFALKFFASTTSLYDLLDEIDDFILASTTAATNMLIKIFQQKIKEEEDFRSKLANAIPGFIYVFDLQEENILYANNKLEEILGYSSDKLLEVNNNFYKLITDEEHWRSLQKRRSEYASGNGSVKSHEVKFRDIKGNYKLLCLYETILKYDDTGRVKEIIGLAFDITHQKEISQALELREAQLLEAQSIAHIGSFDWDITGEKSTTNTPEIYKIFELEESGKFEKFMQHVHSDDIQKVEEALSKSFKTGVYECEYRYIKKGQEKMIWSRGVVTIVDSVPVRMIGTVQDVTAIKQIETQLTQKTLELENSNQNLQQFASVASHDLKEPLRKISFYSSKILLAERSQLSDTSSNSLNKIVESVGRMQRMIDDILEFSSIENNQKKEWISLELLLSDVKDFLSLSITNKKAEIISDGLPSAYVIAPLIRQMFQNLVGNALKFSKEDEPPVITITHAYVDTPTQAGINRQLEVCIADNGIGFDSEDSDKIFGLFHRLHGKSQFDGSGLGLSICKKIAEKHSGTITAQSSLNKGSTFIVRLS